MPGNVLTVEAVRSSNRCEDCNRTLHHKNKKTLCPSCKELRKLAAKKRQKTKQLLKEMHRH